MAKPAISGVSFSPMREPFACIAARAPRASNSRRAFPSCAISPALWHGAAIEWRRTRRLPPIHLRLIEGSVCERGALIPNASITVTNTATNVARLTTTNTAGIYSFRPTARTDSPVDKKKEI